MKKLFFRPGSITPELEFFFIGHKAEKCAAS